MSGYLINGKPGVSPHARFVMAICPACQQHTDYIEPRHMEPAAVDAWRDDQQRSGKLTRARMARSVWREGACLCAA